MRKYCLYCVIKHLSQAFVNQIEAENGYPPHSLLVIGHLAEASEECFGASKELADEIRQYRLLYMENSAIDIPYFELYDKVKKLITEKDCGNCVKAREDFKSKIKEMEKEEKNVHSL